MTDPLIEKCQELIDAISMLDLYQNSDASENEMQCGNWMVVRFQRVETFKSLVEELYKDFINSIEQRISDAQERRD